jgi:hypothetical protein
MNVSVSRALKEIFVREKNAQMTVVEKESVREGNVCVKKDFMVKTAL